MEVFKYSIVLLLRPWLWPSALRFVPSRWWTYPPFLPLPPKEYIDFRLTTMYGDSTVRPTLKELVKFLEWCRKFHKLSKEAACPLHCDSCVQGFLVPRGKYTHHPLSTETKAKLSAAQKGKHHIGHPMSEATKAKLSAARKGKPNPHASHPMSEATKAKLSAARKGKPNPHKGHPMSAATRAKLSAARLGKPHPHRGHPMSAATRAKISAALRGRKHPHRGHSMSAATRAKISASLRAYYARKAT